MSLPPQPSLRRSQALLPGTESEHPEKNEGPRRPPAPRDPPSEQALLTICILWRPNVTASHPVGRGFESPSSTWGTPATAGVLRVLAFSRCCLVTGAGGGRGLRSRTGGRSQLVQGDRDGLEPPKRPREFERERGGGVGCGPPSPDRSAGGSYGTPRRRAAIERQAATGWGSRWGSACAMRA
jgi:hypothetical protein